MRLTVVEWTDRVADYMRIADVLATKPGGITLAEAAACRVPLVLFDAIPGPEEENAKIFVGANAAVKADGPEQAAAEILSLIVQPDRMEQMRRNIGEFAKSRSAAVIVERALLTVVDGNNDRCISSNSVRYDGHPLEMFGAGGVK